MYTSYLYYIHIYFFPIFRPQEIDEAARRRFVKRLYIPLPETAARRQIVVNLLAQQTHSLNDQMLDEICQKSDGIQPHPHFYLLVIT